MNAEAPLSPEQADEVFQEQVLAKWRTDGRELITEQHADFRSIITEARARLTAGELGAAAAAVQVAASAAVLWHPGLFASRELDALLTSLGRRAVPCEGSVTTRRVAGSARRIAHVATRVGAVGGHARMMLRWIEHDASNCHALVLTRQHERIPVCLQQAVARTGGFAHCLRRQPGGLLGRARELQSLLRSADIVILHVHNQDTIPFIALAGMRQKPRVLLLDHADHLFWLGSSLVDLVISTRCSGQRLCWQRRGVPPDRSHLLPLCLGAAARRSTKQVAKRELGLRADSVLLLSVARAVKYRPIGGIGFADPLVPLLRRHPNVQLLVVGPGQAVDWSAAERVVPGQILVRPEQMEVRRFYEAADIYLDSFPFVSITSMLEAGLHGLPLVTRYPFGPGSEVFGTDSPGLDRSVIRVETSRQLLAALDALVSDAAAREALGGRTEEEIASAHVGDAWRSHLEHLYDRALDLEPRLAWPDADLAPAFEDVDLFLPFIHGDVGRAKQREARLALATEADLRMFAWDVRIRTWLRMARRGEFVLRRRLRALRYLLPERSARTRDESPIWDLA